MVDVADAPFDLAQALAAHPLPEALPDAVVNRTELATAMDCSENTITKWLKKGLPVLQQGTNGQAYEFRLSHCYAWRLWDEGQEDARRRASEAAAAQWSMFFRGETEADGRPFKSAKDIKAESEAAMAQMAADEKRGALVRVQPMQALLEDLLIGFQNALVTLPDFAEREFALTPAQVATLEAWSRETIETSRATIEAEIVNASGSVVSLAAEGAR